MSTSNLNDLNVSSLFDLLGRVAVVTGGGTGIGLMIAKGLSANGAKVYVTGRREEVLNQVHLQYPDIHPLRMDVSSKEEIANAVKILEEKEGKLDILVNKLKQLKACRRMSAEEKGTDLWSNAHFFNQYNFQDWADVFNINTTEAQGLPITM
ncbi:hypothetical protein VNI00_003683 [Paramarasmius palmivorus]|uniref:Uncharacterized protein n=1 Tax=Paramarasmius palmivorus TaxID=297713 RepID=A0AAW0DSY5_9AGAR